MTLSSSQSGAVGGTIAGRLAEAGHDVILIARGKHLEALQQNGLELVDPDRRCRLQIAAVSGPEELILTERDVLVLAVKSQDTGAALQRWADQRVAGGRTAGDILPIFCAQNGVENERTALRTFANVYGICVWLPAVHLHPGSVVVRSAPVSGSFVLGRYPDGLDERVAEVAHDLSEAPFRVRVSQKVMRWKHAKLIRNLINALDAIVEPNADSTGLLADAVAEAQRVFEAAGIEYASVTEEENLRAGITIKDVLGLSEAGSSSWQSLAKRSGNIEVDYLNGEIVLLGRLHGIPTPYNCALQRITNGLAWAGGAPRSWPLGRLIEAIRAEVHRAA